MWKKNICFLSFQRHVYIGRTKKTGFVVTKGKKLLKSNKRWPEYTLMYRVIMQFFSKPPINFCMFIRHSYISFVKTAFKIYFLYNNIRFTKKSFFLSKHLAGSNQEQQLCAIEMYTYSHDALQLNHTPR